MPKLESEFYFNSDNSIDSPELNKVKNHTNNKDNRKWETLLEKSGFDRVNSNIDVFATKLNEIKSQDSFSLSPAYYLMTGRNGLWYVSDNKMLAVVCWHPNLKDRFLVFFPQETTPTGFIKDVLEILPLPPKGLQVARVTAYQEQHIINANCSNFLAYKITESSLDWKYPVHILDGESVIKHRGKKYGNLRYVLNKLETDKFKVEKINLAYHLEELNNLVYLWAEKRELGQYSLEDFITSQNCLFNYLHVRELNIEGEIYFYKDCPVGFSIWDYSQSNNDLCNFFNMVFDNNIKGISEKIILTICQYIKSQGRDKLNIGGSETYGLNQFKKKFCPSYSYNLSSYEIHKANL